MIRWATFLIFSTSLAAAVLLKGGVYAQQWQWIALAVGFAGMLSLASRPPFPRGGLEPQVSDVLLALLLAWMIFQLLPLPMGIVARLSPHRWQSILAARSATGVNPGLWAALSVAPSATFERLVDVTPAMAAFVAARQLGWCWRKKMWIAAAPVILIGCAESILGLLQFYAMRTGASLGLPVASASGTYVNRNHFAGFLELAFPLALMAAVYSVKTAWAAVLSLGGAGCLLAGIVVSQSRTGFLAAILAAAATSAIMLSRRPAQGVARSRWRIAGSLALPLLILIFLPTQELAGRLFGWSAADELSMNTRVEIWRDTLHMLPAYGWAGCGLGAYQSGAYAYQTIAPVNRLDFAHNDYLQILAELGAPGGILAALLLAWVLSRAAGAALRQPGGRNRELAVGLFAALLSLSLHGLADFNLYIPANALAFAWLAGLAVSPGLRDA